MNRRNFMSLTGTFTGGALLLPDFLFSLSKQESLIIGEQCIVFVQLNGGNDGLNTYIPYLDPLYYHMRPKIAISKDDVIAGNNEMAFHPALKGLAEMQQNGDLSVLQNVGYPEHNRSHFRSQEIWQTASDSNQYINEGWLGRYLDLQCTTHNPTAGVNIDSIDNLSLKGKSPNAITIKNPENFKIKNGREESDELSENLGLDFIRKIANSAVEGSEKIQKALTQATEENFYPKTGLGKNLAWIGRLIKGNLNSKVYYTSLSGFDTHDNQLPIHRSKLTELNDALYSFYSDMKNAKLLQNVTIVVFSEFGRRVQDNGNGTDHGTAAPMFIIGGNNKGKIIGKNPNLSDLQQGDLKHQIDFRSVYATLLHEKLNFNPKSIGIKNPLLTDLF
ncbi:MAG: hypothetical protein ACI9L6_000374 [Flavobacterium sp.]|jgi:uncharacterized protein (DUF1501 family)